MNVLLLSLAACKPEEPGPLGIPLDEDHVIRAGGAIVDLTPEITETYVDGNGNHSFDGCLDDPDGTRCGGEPFTDTNGNGRFDAVFMGGYGPRRPALTVHDPITARAIVIAEDGQYVALVGLDLVGLGYPRIHAARDALAADGFDPGRLLAASTHNHQGPDTMGLWGDPEDLANPTSGLIQAYQERVSAGIEDAVREAAGSMVPVTLRVGAVRMRDRDPYFNGDRFGGKNPTSTMHGLGHDIRDPLVVSDQVLVLQGTGEDGVVFTWTNHSGHPELWGGDNTAISADWVGVTRDVLEAEYGGVAVHMPESLGGMQSALGGDVPLVGEDGVHAYEQGESGDLLDADGDPVPVWAGGDTWDFVRSFGWHIAEAAEDALASGEDIDAVPIEVVAADLQVPVDNLAYKLLGPKGMFDLGWDDLVTDPDACPEVSTSTPGCLRSRTFQARIGPVGFVAVPGELFPEIGWGFPDDPVFVSESATLAARGPASVYFPQSDPDCVDVTFEECRTEEAIGACDCLSIHTAPYAISTDAEQGPLLDALPADVRYRAILGMTDNYLSYLVPEPDFHLGVNLLSGNDGDHYEDTVSPSPVFATKVQQAQATLALGQR